MHVSLLISGFYTSLFPLEQRTFLYVKVKDTGQFILGNTMLMRNTKNIVKVTFKPIGAGTYNTFYNLSGNIVANSIGAVKALAPGMYIVRSVVGGKTVTDKVLVK